MAYHDSNPSQNGSEPHSPGRDPFAFSFPELTVLPADTETLGKLSTREKYGALFYLGVGGLAILLMLLGWFAINVWSLKAIWINVYALHDVKKPDLERINAAYALARDPDVNARQLWDLSLERSLPPLSRYLLAESLRGDAAEDHSREYALAVAKSEGWPPWLRLLLTRPLAYSSLSGGMIATTIVNELTTNPDEATALWACLALAGQPGGDSAALSKIQAASRTEGPNRQLADMLLEALEAETPDRRSAILDRATIAMRTQQVEARKVWQGYRVEGARIVRERP